MSAYCQLVNRVHWIRARALQKRWREERIIIGYEMEWTRNYYNHQSKIWTERRMAAATLGHHGAAAYASRKVAWWLDIASSVDDQFKSVNPNYHRL
jgi:hypothetical protein